MIKRPRLVNDWKKSLRWYSQQVNIALISVGPTWLLLPEEWRAAVPPLWLAVAASVLGIAGLIGRVVSQEPPP